VWREEVEPWLRTWKTDVASPTAVHRLCAWLYRRGWLRRIYTQNVDGLHLHPDLGLPKEVVVECHGSMRDGTCVLYGDQLPSRFETCLTEDFPVSGCNVDLLIVLGTSLQVAPFCGVPNMAPPGCVRVLVNNNLNDCRPNYWSCSGFLGDDGGLYGSGLARPARCTSLGSLKRVRLDPLWWDSKSSRRWQQLCVESNCDEFVARLFETPVLQEQGLHIEA